MKINNRVKFLRKFLNEDQKTFCEKIGLSQSQLSRIENNKQKGVDLEAVLSIVSEYNVNPKWLKGDIGEDETPLFLSSLNETDINKTIKERDEYRDKLIKVQEELLEYKTEKITILKNIDNVSK